MMLQNTWKAAARARYSPRDSRSAMAVTLSGTSRTSADVNASYVRKGLSGLTKAPQKLCHDFLSSGTWCSKSSRSALVVSTSWCLRSYGAPSAWPG